VYFILLTYFKTREREREMEREREKRERECAQKLM